MVVLPRCGTTSSIMRVSDGRRATGDATGADCDGDLGVAVGFVGVCGGHRGWRVHAFGEPRVRGESDR